MTNHQHVHIRKMYSIFFLLFACWRLCSAHRRKVCHHLCGAARDTAETSLALPPPRRERLMTADLSLGLSAQKQLLIPPKKGYIASSCMEQSDKDSCLT